MRITNLNNSPAGYTFWTDNAAYHRLSGLYSIIFSPRYRESLVRDGISKYIAEGEVLPTFLCILLNLPKNSGVHPMIWALQSPTSLTSPAQYLHHGTGQSFGLSLLTILWCVLLFDFSCNDDLNSPLVGFVRLHVCVVSDPLLCRYYCIPSTRHNATRAKCRCHARHYESNYGLGHNEQGPGIL